MNLFLEELDKTIEVFELEEEQFHHLKNVIRAKIGSKGKVFNGKGLIASYEILSINKKSAEIKFSEFNKVEKPNSLKLILGVPKKEYFESILKSCVQIGINDIYLIHTKFSPWKFKDHPRFLKIIESAIVQSENPYSPKIEFLNDLRDLSKFSSIVGFSTEVDGLGADQGQAQPEAYLIGPEGGFHREEIELLKTLENIRLVKLATPIMKAETAVVYGAGLLSY